MKKINLTFLFSFLAITLYAQNSYMEIVRSAIKTEKKALVAEVMQLSDEESSVFWPVYNEYQDKLYKINTDYFNIVKDFADNFENMSDDKATEILTKANKFSLAEVKLEKTYLKKMMKVISPQQTLRFFQASNKIEIMIDPQINTFVTLFTKSLFLKHQE